MEEASRTPRRRRRPSFDTLPEPLRRAVEVRAGIIDLLSGWAGRLLWSGGQPDPPGIPGLRAFQAAQAAPTVAWLVELLAD